MASGGAWTPGRVTGYATDLAYFAHAVAETTTDLQALIGSAPAFGGPGILVREQQPAAGMVPRRRPQGGAADELDDHRSLQRAHRGVPALDPPLTPRSSATRPRAQTPRTITRNGPSGGVRGVSPSMYRHPQDRNASTV